MIVLDLAYWNVLWRPWQELADLQRLLLREGEPHGSPGLLREAKKDGPPRPRRLD